jgi:hypothetical protein
MTVNAMAQHASAVVKTTSDASTAMGTQRQH